MRRKRGLLRRTVKTVVATAAFISAFSALTPSTILPVPAARAQEAENRVQKNIRLLKSGEPKQRRMAAEMLGIIGNPGAFPDLMEALEDEDTAVRANAAEALGKLGDPGARHSLIDKLKDPSSEVRMNAALALGVMGVTAKQFKTILGMLGEGKTPEERSGAAIALGALQKAEAVPALIEALEDSDSDVKTSAVWALENLGGLAVLPLVELLNNGDPYMRTLAAMLLGRIGDPRALPVLLKMSQNDPIAEVRETAQGAARSIAER